jgi:hypothetical protein
MVVNNGDDIIDVTDTDKMLKRIQELAKIENVRITQHAHQEMIEENITYEEVLETIMDGKILENYPEHRRGACCLLNGRTKTGRPLHIVCTTNRPFLVIITVYEPRPPKWVTSEKRREKVK